MRKNCSSDREKLEQFYANSERSEQFLATECFFNLCLEISQISKNRRIITQIGKKLLGLRNLQEKLENSSYCLAKVTFTKVVQSNCSVIC